MHTSPSPRFGSLLRQYRLAAGLTQEELAHCANLSRATIDSLERGTRLTPHTETMSLLLEALQLSEEERVLLEAAARRRHPLRHDRSTIACSIWFNSRFGTFSRIPMAASST